ncbi:glycosyltransferase [Spirulina sp. CS-785/01]|uniref:glycosyltransferase n=1 Tax=Spirulina sp. CS-785/01 TaxID=3021716 RepID=UPI00232D277B|nr:glycosyltransferase [Spirulina sp. CS-785/01]MDB9315395.1 glycosyltransferase [Spirulina sp. CS-785/01]
MRSLNLLFVSTPVGPLGSGLGGGVELTLYNMAQELQRRGHQIKIVAPLGSKLPGLEIQEVKGNVQVAAQSQGRETPVMMPSQSAIGAMWEYARLVQGNYDLLVNFAYDWLPFYLTPFFERPVAHFVSMGSLSEAMDDAIAKVGAFNPDLLAFYSPTQAQTFPPLPRYHYLWSAVDLDQYQFCETPEDYFAWVGRIAPEKALEDAIQAAQQANIPLRIFGKIADRQYWDQIRYTYPDAPIDYRGFLDTQTLQQQLRCSRGLLMTPRWVEAFGNVVIEALACGVPVISYQRGGPAEIIEDGKIGFLVTPDHVPSLVTAMGNISAIDRRQCRQQVQQQYSLNALGDRVERWFQNMA